MARGIWTSADTAEEARDAFLREHPDATVVACEPIDIGDIPLTRPPESPLWALAFEDPDPSQFLQDADPIGKARRNALELWGTIATDPEQLSTGVLEGKFTCPGCGASVMLELPPDRVRQRPGFGPTVFSRCPECQVRLRRHKTDPPDAWRVVKQSPRQPGSTKTGELERPGMGLGIRRACVFCGAEDQKISKEHLWSRWMGKYVEGGDDTSIGTSRALASDTGEVKRLEEWREPAFGRKIAGPCKPCNEGWMERIEAEARPFLIPMLRNQPVDLNPEAQRAVARWATLKLLIAQLGHGHDKQWVHRDRYRLFYIDRSLPTGASVWLGRYSGAGPWPTAYHCREFYLTPNGGEEPDTPNAYLTAFSIGYLAFLYWGNELRRGPTPDVSRISSYLTQIWPATGVISWPPPDLLEADGLDFAMSRFPIRGWI